MSISSTLDRVHFQAKHNKWMRYFTILNRIGLAIGFLPSGFVKIAEERFTALSVNHPMGNYLEALHRTGWYYPFIGVMQVTAAILLLIPRTAILGALIYFPIILNIAILSFAVRFDGSLFSAPLMILSNLYLLCWEYDKLKFILPFNHHKNIEPAKPVVASNKFPIRFFSGVFVTVVLLELLLFNMYTVRPFNTLRDCKEQCKGSDKSKACEDFCDCIHLQGQPLDSCLEKYNKAPKDSIRKK
ncbi:MAG: DoxX family protein [Chitinophagaceae bacterium]